MRPANEHDYGVYSVGVNGVDETGTGDDVSSWAGYDRALYQPSATLARTLLLLGMALGVLGLLYGLARLWRIIWRNV